MGREQNHKMGVIPVFSKNHRNGLLLSLGPGLLMAGAAIGGSHLVQSTRAGANYGFALVWAVILANIFKYPFFEYGPRYAAATGQSLLHGYLLLGKWAITVYLVFTFCTMFIVETALTLVTAGLAGQLFGIQLTPGIWSVIVLAVCMLILMIGKYPLLDKLIKGIIVVLALSTLFAIIALMTHGHTVPKKIEPITVWNLAGVSFIVALMGWMPSVIDISVWHSLWSIERQKQTDHKPTMDEALFDFNLGYIITALLALAFLTLGALVMFGTGKKFSNSGVEFASQLVYLYTDNLGSWTWPIISVAAFTTMFSTTLTVTDAFPRVLRHATELVYPGIMKRVTGEWLYYGIMILLVSVTLFTVSFFKSGMKSMIDLATTISFLTTPVLAYINYRVIMSPHVPEQAIPSTWMRILSWAGIIFWGGFAIFFLYFRIMRFQ